MNHIARTTAGWVSPISGEHWTFNLNYDRMMYSQKTGPVMGYNGFVGRVVGDKVGEKQYEGHGTSQQYQFVP